MEMLEEKLKTVEMENDDRDELLLQCAQGRRMAESFMCRTWLVKTAMEDNAGLREGRKQGNKYNDQAKGVKNQKMGQPYLYVFAGFVTGLSQEKEADTGLLPEEIEWLKQYVVSLKQPQDVGKWMEVWMAKEARDTAGDGKKMTIIKYRFKDLKGVQDEELKEQEKLATIIRKHMLKLEGEEQMGPAPPVHNERILQKRLDTRRKDMEGKYMED